MSRATRPAAGRSRRGEDTRRRIEQAAAGLFAERGYASTSVQAVADAAGVHAQTVYQAYGTKASLLAAVGTRLVAGEDDPAVHPSQRAWSRRIEAEPDPAGKLRLYVQHIREVTPRIVGLIDLLRATAPAEPDAALFLDQIEEGRLMGPLNLFIPLAEQGMLRPGLTLAAACDITYALVSPDTFRALVTRRGWSWDQAEEWLTDCLTRALLPPGQSQLPKARLAAYGDIGQPFQRAEDVLSGRGNGFGHDQQRCSVRLDDQPFSRTEP